MSTHASLDGLLMSRSAQPAPRGRLHSGRRAERRAALGAQGGVRDRAERGGDGQAQPDEALVLLSERVALQQAGGLRASQQAGGLEATPWLWSERSLSLLGGWL